jgi:ABC-type phosphate transport system substrate-binding protein
MWAVLAAIAAASAQAVTLLRGGGVGWLQEEMSRGNPWYQAATVSYEGIGSMAALRQLEEGLIDFAAVDYASLVGAQNYSSDVLVVLPHVGVALAAAYSFCGAVPADSCAFLNQTLTLAAAELAAVLHGNVTRWLDPQIVALNPWMGAEPFASAIGASREIILVGEQRAADTTRLTAELLRNLLPSVGLAAFNEDFDRTSI